MNQTEKLCGIFTESKLRPNEVDVRYIDPIASGLRNIPGEKGYFLANMEQTLMGLHLTERITTF